MRARRKESGRCFYYVEVDGRREVPLGPVLSIALQRYPTLIATRARLSRRAVTEAFAPTLLRLARRNAGRRGVACTLSLEDVRGLIARAGGRCEVTGLLFDLAPRSGSRVRPHVPSIDRIEAGGAYAVENCRLVCAAVNLALNEFGEAMLLSIAAGLLRSRRKLRTDPEKLRTGSDGDA